MDTHSNSAVERAQAALAISQGIYEKARFHDEHVRELTPEQALNSGFGDEEALAEARAKAAQDLAEAEDRLAQSQADLAEAQIAEAGEDTADEGEGEAEAPAPAPEPQDILAQADDVDPDAEARREAKEALKKAEAELSSQEWKLRCAEHELENVREAEEALEDLNALTDEEREEDHAEQVAAAEQEVETAKAAARVTEASVTQAKAAIAEAQGEVDAAQAVLDALDAKAEAEEAERKRVAMLTRAPALAFAEAIEFEPMDDGRALVGECEGRVSYKHFNEIKGRVCTAKRNTAIGEGKRVEGRGRVRVMVSGAVPDPVTNEPVVCRGPVGTLMRVRGGNGRMGNPKTWHALGGTCKYAGGEVMEADTLEALQDALTAQFEAGRTWRAELEETADNAAQAA